MKKYLYDLGLDENKIGYTFLLEALDLLKEDKVLTLHICRLYDILAERHNTSRQFIERSLNCLFRKSFLLPKKTREQVLFIFNDLKKKKLI